MSVLWEIHYSLSAPLSLSFYVRESHIFFRRDDVFQKKSKNSDKRNEKD